VPTNVIPHYQIPLSYSFTPLPDGGVGTADTYLLETEAGIAVASEVRNAENGYLEIAPNALLAPNTKYRVRAKWKGPTPDQTFEDQVSFTTGDGARTGEVPQPVAAMTNLAWQQDPFSSCSPPAKQICVALKGTQLDVEWAYIGLTGQADATQTYATRESFFMTDLNAATAAAGSCLQLRTRAPDGAHSEPLVLCGRDAPLVELSGPDILSVGCGADGIEVHRAAVSGNGSGGSNEGMGMAGTGVMGPPVSNSAGQSPLATRTDPNPNTDSVARHVESCSVGFVASGSGRPASFALATLLAIAVRPRSRKLRWLNSARARSQP
jgi:hypothetical protein